ncbi:PASTA domain-containing protein [Actinoplanes sp. Pm04-4]|uniref:PASTA domain-containing protein n=1 Tax=Paractinoplanes pyxinae TaxID=2997416 RepID=A0ABT4B149_9ACTN|nr:PASTA domain-containing protein [Actinoplanes pyxinae]MCY1139348.1 PASTA domain-containing protein [Actinoplanes pyxinae]
MHQPLRVLASIVLAVAAAGCSSPEPDVAAPPPAAVTPSAVASGAASAVPSAAVGGGTVPDVTGRRLSEAEQLLGDAGFSSVRAVDGTGAGRRILHKDNWVVQSQDPPAGSEAAAGLAITLSARKPTDGQAEPTSARGVVPDVVCQNLQTAQEALRGAGFFVITSKDGLGQGRLAVVDRNWVVLGQSAEPGSSPEPTELITLTVVKYGEPTGTSGCPS